MCKNKNGRETSFQSHSMRGKRHLPLFLRFFRKSAKYLFEGRFVIINHTPQKNKTAKYFSFACMLLGCLLVATVFLDVPYKVIFEFIALIFYVLSFELMFRYSYTTYTYTLEDGNFIVSRRTGQKRQTVCNVSMRTAIDIVKTPKTKEEKASFEARFGRAKIRYNYSQIMMPKETYSYLFRFNGEIAEIVFEPSEEMVTAIRAVLLLRNDMDDMADA